MGAAGAPWVVPYGVAESRAPPAPVMWPSLPALPNTAGTEAALEYSIAIPAAAAKSAAQALEP